MVAPEKVYELYKEISADPVSFISMEVICANPWTYPNLLKDPRFIKKVKNDGGLLPFFNITGCWVKVNVRNQLPGIRKPGNFHCNIYFFPDSCYRAALPAYC